MRQFLLKSSQPNEKLIKFGGIFYKENSYFVCRLLPTDRVKSDYNNKKNVIIRVTFAGPQTE